MKFLGCGGTSYQVSQAVTEITTPNYPYDYPDNTVCANVVNFAHDQVIELSFLQFEIEEASKW